MQSSCPSCGAPIIFKNEHSLYTVCDYCSTISIRKDMNLEEVGKAAALKPDASPIQLGTIGRVNNTKFEVIGRIQLEFSAGFWNEWHISWGGKSAWLGETHGIYALTQIQESEDVVPSFDSVKVGSAFKYKNKEYFATDIQKGKCVSGEGELPFAVNSGYDAPVIDFVSRSEEFATVDYSEESPIVFKGYYKEFKELNLSNLKKVYGWKKPRDL